MAMKFLISSENLFPALGGGEVFFQELAAALAARDEVSAAYAGERKDMGKVRNLSMPASTIFKNIPLLRRTVVREVLAHYMWKYYLCSIIPETDPDFIITQLELTPSSVESARKFGKKSIAYISNYDHFCPFSFRGRSPFCSRSRTEGAGWACFRCAPLPYKLQYPFFRKYIAWQEKALRSADLILANSSFTAGVLRRFYGLESRIFHPVALLDDFAVKSSGEYVTFINPIPIKGSDIFFSIAESMPDKKFLVVGGAGEVAERAAKAGNMTHIPRAADMRDVYRKTRILLVPSTWYEPFGRVALEAGISGIPCIGSNRGGLADAIGGGILIDDICDIRKWSEAIETVDSAYRKFSSSARKHASQFTKARQMKRFYGFLGSL